MTVLLSHSAPQISRQARGAAAVRLSPEYRDVVDGSVALMHQYKARLQRIQAAAPHAEIRIQDTTHDLWVDWRALWTDAAQCLREIAGDGERLRAAKDYTESQLTAELLIARGADVNRRNQSGATALDWARRAKEPAIVERLQRAGAR